jgi:hypothetical protein
LVLLYLEQSIILYALLKLNVCLKLL